MKPVRFGSDSKEVEFGQESRETTASAETREDDALQIPEQHPTFPEGLTPRPEINIGSGTLISESYDDTPLTTRKEQLDQSNKDMSDLQDGTKALEAAGSIATGTLAYGLMEGAFSLSTFYESIALGVFGVAMIPFVAGAAMRAVNDFIDAAPLPKGFRKALKLLSFIGALGYTAGNTYSLTTLLWTADMLTGGMGTLATLAIVGTLFVGGYLFKNVMSWSAKKLFQPRRP